MTPLLRTLGLPMCALVTPAEFKVRSEQSNDATAHETGLRAEPSSNGEPTTPCLRGIYNAIVKPEGASRFRVSSYPQALPAQSEVVLSTEQSNGQSH